MQPKILGVDIGNSGLRVTELDLAGQALGVTKRINWRHPSSELPVVEPKERTQTRYLPQDPQWLDELKTLFAERRVCHWMISSVRQDALKTLLSKFNCLDNHTFQVVKHTDLELSIQVDEPERVGIDRLLAAWAASRISTSRPLIVIQAGSAVTVDLVSSQVDSQVDSGTDSQVNSGADSGVNFEGGAIVPGVPMMLRLLGRAAEQLPEIDADELTSFPEIPGKNTLAAMKCGAASALVGGVQHLIQRYRLNFGKNVPVILSGGDGMRIASYIPPPLVVEPDLVQRGLLQLARSRSSEKQNHRGK